ncbi:MAG: hypothetical protein KGZ88_18000 [Methylomicrobium sp.]|nr:hypothetical protein [Methylomicrobium sp.]
MAAKYIKSTSNLSPKNVWNKMNSGEWSFEDCPWVILGNVYTSVNFTGDGSWQEIVRDLYNKGQRTFTVLAGRHGDQLGQQIDLSTGKFIPRDSKDTAINPKDDMKVANSLNTNPRLAGINVIVTDVGSGTHDNVDKLKAEIDKQLLSNRIVILAWCYSLFAMKSGWDNNVKNAWPQVFSGPDMTPISFTAKDWDWLSKYTKCSASIAAERLAVSD